MIVRTKTDHTGRSTNHLTGTRTKKVFGLPQGVGFSTALPRDVARSPAIACLSLNAHRILWALIGENGATGGRQNGELKLPYCQLVAAGVSRSAISAAISELEALGLVAVFRGKLAHGVDRPPNLYRLTWLGSADGAEASNNWKEIATREVAVERLEKLKADARKRRDAAKARREAEALGNIVQGNFPRPNERVSQAK